MRCEQQDHGTWCLVSGTGSNSIRQFLNHLTNLTQQGPSRDTDSASAGHIPSIYEKKKQVHYRTHNSPSVVPILR